MFRIFFTLVRCVDILKVYVNQFSARFDSFAVSLKVFGGSGVETVLMSEIGVLRIVRHWSEMIMFRLRQIVVEPASDMHGQESSMSLFFKFEVLVIVVSRGLWSRRRGAATTTMLGIVFLLLLGFFGVVLFLFLLFLRSLFFLFFSFFSIMLLLLLGLGSNLGIVLLLLLFFLCSLFFLFFSFFGIVLLLLFLFLGLVLLLLFSFFSIMLLLLLGFGSDLGIVLLLLLFFLRSLFFLFFSMLSIVLLFLFSFLGVVARRSCGGRSRSISFVVLIIQAHLFASLLVSSLSSSLLVGRLGRFASSLTLRFFLLSKTIALWLIPSDAVVGGLESSALGGRLEVLKQVLVLVHLILTAVLRSVDAFANLMVHCSFHLSLSHSVVIFEAFKGHASQTLHEVQRTSFLRLLISLGLLYLFFLSRLL